MTKQLLALALLVAGCDGLPPAGRTPGPPPTILPGHEAGAALDGGPSPTQDGAPLLADRSAPLPKLDQGVAPKPDQKPPTPGLQLSPEEKDLVDAINKERASLG